ncbi:MAG TPA: hypothetical protein H9824_05680 [Candidatus Bacteroides pullicola]|uniref:Uncharacterized protein n=1 Tax=Candidatus Bacteroides pullicola TaxID=2838475 RepID=A0A9D2CJS0_9BACE|nr:hypothetical protein [Candidatus Bacteroides pullicola]
MITEQYVSFGTAKLLKKAGFDEVCATFYSSKEGAPVLLHSRNSELEKKHYSRPTQALAARWLREVHGLNISACFNSNTYKSAVKGWFYMREDTNRNDPDSVYCDIQDYESYEAAFEAGLQKALKLIIKNKEQ